MSSAEEDHVIKAKLKAEQNTDKKMATYGDLVI